MVNSAVLGNSKYDQVAFPSAADLLTWVGLPLNASEHQLISEWRRPISLLKDF